MLLLLQDAMVTAVAVGAAAVLGYRLYRVARPQQAAAACGACHRCDQPKVVSALVVHAPSSSTPASK